MGMKMVHKSQHINKKKSLKQITSKHVFHDSQSCEDGLLGNHDVNMFMTLKSFSIIIILINLKTMESWCYKKVVELSNLTLRK
jgi:hypothetical protein